MLFLNTANDKFVHYKRILKLGLGSFEIAKTKAVSFNSKIQNSKIPKCDMLSKKAQYALKALSYLTEKYNEGPVLIQEISGRKHIPIKFLENILLQLKYEGVLESKKGKGGGYFLKQHPASLPIARILRIIDGPIAMLPCVSLYFYKKCDDCQEISCRINKMFCEVRDATLQILEKRTLMDLADIRLPSMDECGGPSGKL